MMTQCVDRHPLMNLSPGCRNLYIFLKVARVNMVPANNILDSQIHTFPEPQAASVDGFCHEKIRTRHLLKQKIYFRFRQDNRQPPFPFGPDGIPDIIDRFVQHVPEQKRIALNA